MQQNKDICYSNTSMVIANRINTTDTPMISSNRVLVTSNDYTKINDNNYETFWEPKGINTWFVVEPIRNIKVMTGFRMKFQCLADTELKIFTNVIKKFSINNGNRKLAVSPSNPIFYKTYNSGIITIDEVFTNPISNISNLYIEFNKITNIYEIEFFGI